MNKLLGIIVLVCCIVQQINAGNDRPYGVDVRGSEGAGSLGQDASANGYAGSSLVAPLASEGYNSPRARYAPNSAFPGNPNGIGFGGFGWRPAQSSTGGY